MLVMRFADVSLLLHFAALYKFLVIIIIIIITVNAANIEVANRP